MQAESSLKKVFASCARHHLRGARAAFEEVGGGGLSDRAARNKRPAAVRRTDAWLLSWRVRRALASLGG